MPARPHHRTPKTRRALLSRVTAWTGLVVFLVFAIWYWPPGRVYEALLVLVDIDASAAPSHWKTITPPPRRTTVTYAVHGRTSVARGRTPEATTIAGHARTGDLYLPGAGAVAAGIVLVPGIVPEGKDEPRLVALAHTLARARFAVLVPEMAGFRAMRIRPADTRAVADALAFLASRTDLTPQGRLGMVAFSYAAGVSVLAALEQAVPAHPCDVHGSTSVTGGRTPGETAHRTGASCPADVRENIRFIIGIGGYYDLTQVITFFTTGYFQERGQWRHLPPNPYGKWVFVDSSKDYLHNPNDKAVLDTMLRLKLRDMHADIAHLAPQLGPEARAVYDLLTNTDPARTPELIQGLPRRIQEDLTSLTLSNKDLGRLKARLTLVADRNDKIIPYTESIALAHAVPQAELALVRSLIHVEPKGWRYASWEFWAEDLPDFWRLYRVVYSLLGEREQ